MRSIAIPFLLLLAAVEAAFDQPFTSSFSSLQHAPCVSIFHRNGRTGCGTEDHSVDVGHLFYYKGSLPNTMYDYVALVEDYDLTSSTLTTLSKAKGGLLKGILVLNSTDASGKSNQNTFYSPDSRSPQGYGTPSVDLNYGYTAYPWNDLGEDLFSFDLFGVAMAYVPDSTTAESLREEAKSSTKETSIVAEFNYYMGPQNMTSLNCLTWKDVSDEQWNPKCLPLAGTSVWAHAGIPPNPNKNGRRELASSSKKKPVFLLGAGMDSTSMFHDLSPGANTAASNILTVLMAAKLIGSSMTDADMDALPSRIVFALFQGESYGFVGSRNFLRDLAYPGFSCKSGFVRSVTRLADKSDYGCLNPLRPSMRFAELGQIAGMLSVDQVGHAVADGILYVHADKNNDKYGTYLANVLKYCATNKFTVALSSAGNNGNGYPYPPSPLTSLLQLSGGAVSGAVLTGYDYSFTSKVLYHSHMDSASIYKIELNAIAAAATIMARAALAMAYDDGNYIGQGDYQTPAAYAKNLIPELSYSDSTLVQLSNCLFYDGNCDLIRKFSAMEAANEKARTGVNVQSGVSLGTPPNYYVGVYNSYYGQPFVQVGDNAYGAYNGQDYGAKNTDTMTMIPPQLESTIYGLFNDFLGRGSSSTSGSNVTKSCKKLSDCSNVDYCGSYGESVTCTGGGSCVCKRAHYHIALDEALNAAENKPTGYFVVDANDAGVSPIYTEPFWSPSVGVRVYRDVGPLPGVITLVVGLAVGAASLFGALLLKVGLKKEKLY